jgi:hypothetical protein
MAGAAMTAKKATPHKSIRIVLNSLPWSGSSRAALKNGQKTR